MQTVPEKNRIYLEQSFNAVEYKNHPDVAAPFGYSPLDDIVYYNPSDPNFKHIDFFAANTHELSHRIDSIFVQSWENEDFIKAINKYKSTVSEYHNQLYDFCIENDTKGFLSDILSAICEDEFQFFRT